MSSQPLGDEVKSKHQDAGPSASTSKAQATAAAGRRPRILVISMLYISWTREIYPYLLEAIQARAEFRHAIDPLDAFIELSSVPPYDAVIVTDEAAATEPYAQLASGLLQYIREGGTVVFTCLFGCFLTQALFNRFFQRTGLNWRWRSFREATVLKNTIFVPQAVADRLPAHYNQTGVLLHNVDLADAWYSNIDDWIMHGAFDQEAEYSLMNETAAAMGRFCEGKVGYVSDIELGNGSLNIVLAMCDIL